MPSTSRLASASASAVAPVDPASARAASRRRSSCRSSFGWTVKRSGTRGAPRSASRAGRPRPRSTTSAPSVGGVRSLGGCSSTRLGERRLQRLVRGAQAASRPRATSASASSCGDDAFLDELGRVLLAHGRLLLDLLGHERLRVRRLVALVVALPAVADEVDDDVAAEPAPEGQREPDRRDRRLRVVGVDVDDRHVEALREVARVARRAPVGRIRREPDLVVRDQVQRAAGRVAAERPGG